MGALFSIFNNRLHNLTIHENVRFSKSGQKKNAKISYFNIYNIIRFQRL